MVHPRNLREQKDPFPFSSQLASVFPCLSPIVIIRGIAKWIRESQPRCAHVFDTWHIARSIGKAMIKLSKEKGCEKIGNWVKGVRNHLYWCVTSTKQGFQELIAAKWQSFMQHVSNKHDGHPNPMFTKGESEEQLP